MLFAKKKELEVDLPAKGTAAAHTSGSDKDAGAADASAGAGGGKTEEGEGTAAAASGALTLQDLIKFVRDNVVVERPELFAVDDTVYVALRSHALRFVVCCLLHDVTRRACITTGERAVDQAFLCSSTTWTGS